MTPLLAADTSNLHKTALGYAEASTAGYPSGSMFNGITLDSDAILIRYTYSGDANLDGAVNATDFVLLAQNFNAANANWVNGDFNYDGVVNALDFNALATNFGATPIAAPPLLGSLVPEPTTIAWVASLLLARRRRSRLSAVRR